MYEKCLKNVEDLQAVLELDISHKYWSLLFKLLFKLLSTLKMPVLSTWLCLVRTTGHSYLTHLANTSMTTLCPLPGTLTRFPTEKENGVTGGSSEGGG